MFRQIRGAAALAFFLRRPYLWKKIIFLFNRCRPYKERTGKMKTGIFAQRARVDQAVGLYYRKENLTF